MFKYEAEWRETPILRLDSQELFQDPEFVAWLNDASNIKFTWHQPGSEVDEWSDVIVTYDSGDGSNSDMPEHIWDWICEIVKERQVQECLIWLRNLHPYTGEAANAD